MALRERIAKSISQLGGSAVASQTISVQLFNLPHSFIGQGGVISTTAFSVDVQCLKYPTLIPMQLAVFEPVINEKIFALVAFCSNPNLELVSTQLAVFEPAVNVNSCALVASCSDYEPDLISTQLAVPQLAINTKSYTLIASFSEYALFVKTRMRRAKLGWLCKDMCVDLNFGINIWSQWLSFQGHAAGIRFRDRKQSESTLVVGTAKELSLSPTDITTRSDEKGANPFGTTMGTGSISLGKPHRPSRGRYACGA